MLGNQHATASATGRLRGLPALASVAALALAPAAGRAADAQAPEPLRSILEPIRAKHRLPALAAAVVLRGRLVALDAVGLRKARADVAVTRHDQFHIGSCTKAMTATVVGLLVQQRKLRWDTTLAEALPDLAPKMHPQFRTVTITQLLRHRAGLRPNLPKGSSWRDFAQGAAPPRDQRTRFASAHLSQPPAHKPGTKHVYANAGYAIAGAIIERTADAPFETVLRTMLFEPLGMATAGFGAMGTPGKTDQPWQHRLDNKGDLRAIEPGPRSDNPDVLGPAGKVHCSLADWAKFVLEHLPSGAKARALLKPQTLAALHAPAQGGNYAMGWLATERAWGGGRVLTHSGCNTMNYAVAWLAPTRDFAVLVATNQGNGTAPKATDEAAAALIRRFLPHCATTR